MFGSRSFRDDAWQTIAARLHDRMTQSVLDRAPDPNEAFETIAGKPMQHIPVNSLAQANVELGLALSDDELDYLYSMRAGRSMTKPCRNHCLE